MNALQKRRQDALRDAYDSGLSIRAACASCGIAKATVERYYRRWRSQDFGGELACRVSGGTKRAFKAEAARREMSVQGLMANIVEAIAEDNLFTAVLD